MRVTFCRSCGRAALSGFSYCPYCGLALRPGPGMEEACASFDTLERMQSETRARRIEELLVALDGIEAELGELLRDGVRADG